MYSSAADSETRGTGRAVRAHAGGDRAVEDELDRRVDAGGEREVRHLAVEDEVHVDDRRVPSAATRSAPAAAGAAPRRPGCRDDHCVRVDAAASAVTLARRRRRAAAVGLDRRVDGRPEPHVDTGRCRAPRGRVGAVQLAERDGRPADVGRRRLVEQPGLEDLGRERERRLDAGRLTVGSVMRSQSFSIAPARWPWRGEPVAERLVVERRVVEAEPLERERRPAERADGRRTRGAGSGAAARRGAAAPAGPPA